MASPVFFDSINRAAIVLTQKQPFNDWVRSIDPTVNPEEIQEPGLYLIPDFETAEEMEEWIKLSWDLLFSDQMNNWYMDEKLWVNNRSLDLFKKYFSYTLIPLVLDISDDPLETY